ncbi:glutamine synthetase family protein [Zavarzinia sp. CC-PAN008]|uniref:glutamine synthetase family protein n=1 Tax=Zavarzinia sp. CC-PAN008 TaxID=3243332 RepID=UPI003F74474E
MAEDRADTRTRTVIPQAIVRPPTAAAEDEAAAFLARHPEVEGIDIVLVDANGIGRGKTIRAHELAALYRQGRFLPGSILGLDIAGEDVHETGLVWDDGDADRVAWPIPGTLVPQAWTNPRRAQVQLALHELDGSPSPADPRHALLAQDARLKAMGLTPVGAFEIEFYLLDRQRGADGRPRAAALPLTGEQPQTTQVYQLEPLDRLEPFVADVYRAAAAQDLPLETLISEYAVGQYELTLHHHADIARAADDLVAMKRLLRGVAARHGMIACFMAKPFADRVGSGMHLHASLNDPDGSNVFADAPDGSLSPLLLDAIAGLLDTLGQGMLVAAPHHNSWRRFASQSYAPTHATWGINNRSVAVRVPASGGAARHLEHRMAGIDANPYLVGATVLAGMAHGIAGRLDPGAAVTGNAYDAPAGEGDVPAPASWAEAIAAAARSDFLAEALGLRMRDVLVALKRAEHARFARAVSELDYALYLETV